MTQEKEAVVVVDFENTFIPENEWGTWELWVEWWGKLSPFINNLVNEVRSKWWIIIKTKDYHPRWHMSFASSFENKTVITDAFAAGLNPNPTDNPEFFITYDEVKNWDWNNNWASEGVQFDYERLKVYLKTVWVQAMWPDHGIAWEESSEIFSEFDSAEDDITIVKWFVPEEECYSWFGGRELVDVDWEKIMKRSLTQVLEDAYVKTVKYVWIASDYCIPSTAIGWTENWFSSTVFMQGTVWVDPAWTIEALKQMREARVKIIN